MGQDKQIKIKISEKIDTDENIVRLGKEARKALGITKCKDEKIEVWANPFIDSRLYKVKKAFSIDLKNIPKDSIKNTIFVSKGQFDKLFKESEMFGVHNNFWASTKKKTCVGSDPEFILFKNTNTHDMIYAADLLPFDSQIGSDGPLAELRAKPGITPKEHTNNISELINNIHRYINTEEVRCRIFPYVDFESSNSDNEESSRVPVTSVSCGGHIHFGITKKINTNTALNEHKLITEILDRTLAIAMHRLDKDLGVKRRTKQNYGKAGDYRAEYPYNVLEYRVLSATWLLYKDLTEATLTVASDLVEEISSRLVAQDINIDPSKIYSNSFIFGELFPELSELAIYNRDDIERVLQTNPDNDDFLNYTKKSLECMSQIIGSDELETLSRVILSDYKKLDNLNPDFIDNWTSEISIFDHIEK